LHSNSGSVSIESKFLWQILLPGRFLTLAWGKPDFLKIRPLLMFLFCIKGNFTSVLVMASLIMKGRRKSNQATAIANELDEAREATHNFISSYVLQMKCPLQNLASSLQKMQESTDMPADIAAVENILQGMENLLDTLVDNLRQSSSDP
jgi:hypothetical protein